ncbi:MAG: HEAT repeat domain-containing protein, partial [Candidatus Sericytochromatia bacterium]|nr:HEAT repeat domain-containing protein [Candidatus Tanganyikabacteria bacterium]
GLRVRSRLRRGPEHAAALGRKAAAPLVRALEEPRLREAATRALLLLKGDARPALLKRLERRKGAQRAVEVLGRLRPRADAKPLVSFLHDPVAAMRRSAARAISRQGGSLSYTVLAEALSDEDPGVRRIAMGHLTRRPDHRAIKQLVRVAADGDEELSRAASAHIARCGYLAVGPLIESLRTSDPAIRATVGYLLDGCSDHDSLVILTKALEEDDPRILGPVREALARKGPESAPVLVLMAGHPVARVRDDVLALLARFEAPAPALA